MLSRSIDPHPTSPRLGVVLVRDHELHHTCISLLARRSRVLGRISTREGNMTELLCWMLLVKASEPHNITVWYFLSSALSGFVSNTCLVPNILIVDHYISFGVYIEQRSETGIEQRTRRFWRVFAKRSRKRSASWWNVCTCYYWQGIKVRS